MKVDKINWINEALDSNQNTSILSIHQISVIITRIMKKVIQF